MHAELSNMILCEHIAIPNQFLKNKKKHFENIVCKMTAIDSASISLCEIRCYLQLYSR